ncbi:SemiSWEET transporter [Actinoplanes sp. DH11]|uniref:SemiSWEET transporter n=1 Tax=Actinoplanes sp. DH11 TaxID=2857011 RepID=UPI001E433BAE|nr:SemiSWEET transporter [Actinoplanes sp. DH11]
MLTHFFGILGAALSMSIAWPQVYRSCVRRRTSGLSATACKLGVAMPIGWVTYGLLIGDPFQIVTNVVAAGTGLAILAALLLTQPQLRTRRALLTSAAMAGGVLVAIAVISALAALPQVSGPAAAAMLGTVLATVSFVSAIPQPLALLRNRDQDLSGLSPLRWRLAAAACASWLAYGLGTGQPAVWASALVGLTSSLVVCAVLFARTPRRVREVSAATVCWRHDITVRSLAMAGI